MSYEAQTSARRDSIEMNRDKGKLWGVPMVWVSDSKEVLNGISKLTDNAGETDQ